MSYCERCDRAFSSTHALDQHKRDSSRHYVCYECDKDFATRERLVQHWTQSPRHDYCQRCDEHFDDQDDLLAHYEHDHHLCRACGRFFDSEKGLHEHRRQKHADVYCVPCKRMFSSEGNLRSHQRSAVHQDRTVVCPGKGCGRAFISVAARAVHWESGTCPSGVTRSKLDRLVADVDRGGVFIDASRLIEGGPTVIETRATSRAWNGTHYECCVCHSLHTTLAALNAHLNSPAHAEKIYQCPRAWRGCGMKFKTLSAFCMHMESERCDVCRFKKTLEDFVDGLSSGMRRLTCK